MRKACPRCMAYLLDHPALKGWKSCPSCGWACDPHGENLVTRGELLSKRCFRLCSSDGVECTCPRAVPFLCEGGCGFKPSKCKCDTNSGEKLP